MISERLKELITPQLMFHLDTEEYSFIPLMFSEAYRTCPDGLNRITLHPIPTSGDIAMQFLELNGTFIEITSWDYIKTIGEKI